MRIGIYQSQPRFGAVQENVGQAIEDLKESEADLMVLPELFNTGYQFVSREEVESLAEEIPSGKTCQALIALSKTQGMFLVFGMAEKDGQKVYNSAAVTGPNGFVGTYRKVHLFAEEKYHFDPGDTGFQVFDLGPVRIGVMVCFDWLFPESARALALLGADIICHPANLVLPHCQQAMVTRSLENGVFSATANRTGTEARGGKKPLVFTGRSQILDNAGGVLASLGEEKTGVEVVNIDVAQARNKKVTEQNDRLKDRRPGFYEVLVFQKGHSC
ncbi:MAG: nitrilase-related carbon-nitrogen hydrolase [Desulfobacteraceae bacterium]|jgi:predicted amidohydrolase